MSTAGFIALAIGAVVFLAAILFFTLASRSDVRGAGALSGETLQRDTSARSERVSVGVVRDVRTGSDAEAEGVSARSTEVVVIDEPIQELEPWEPPDPDLVGVSRRQFFNRATVTLMSAGIGAFAAAAFVAFLWPTGTGGFGGQVAAGKIGNIKEGIKQGGGFFYVPEAKSWITQYPEESLPAAELVYQDVLLVAMREGLTVLSQKCPHLGCRVPDCQTSQWFECQCHGSQYNRVGEKKAGPAPRGMDRHPATISASGEVVIDTGVKVPGPPIGTNTTGQEAEGPHCTGGGHE
jgi:cytochrome b6-f complex iron-sulfur subunit